jgi:hypothetical protein
MLLLPSATELPRFPFSVGGMVVGVVMERSTAAPALLLLLPLVGGIFL